MSTIFENNRFKFGLEYITRLDTRESIKIHYSIRIKDGLEVILIISEYLCPDYEEGGDEEWTDKLARFYGMGSDNIYEVYPSSKHFEQVKRAAYKVFEFADRRKVYTKKIEALYEQIVDLKECKIGALLEKMEKELEKEQGYTNDK